MTLPSERKIMWICPCCNNEEEYDPYDSGSNGFDMIMDGPNDKCPFCDKNWNHAHNFSELSDNQLVIAKALQESTINKPDYLEELSRIYGTKFWYA